ncbi:MAG: hydratase, partial [Pseudomonadota bacterium]
MYDPFPAARLLYGARVPGQSLTGLPDTILPANLDQAYAVQFALCELLIPTQGPVQGYKVGCTNAKARSLLGID